MTAFEYFLIFFVGTFLIAVALGLTALAIYDIRTRPPRFSPPVPRRKRGRAKRP
jgi:hypothetical protein